MNKKIVAFISLAAMAATPMIAFGFNAGARPEANPGLGVGDLLDKLFNFIWPAFIGFAVIMFIVAGFMFLTARGDAGQIRTAQQAVLWGIVGVAVGVLAFSIPFVVRNVLNI